MSVFVNIVGVYIVRVCVCAVNTLIFTPIHLFKRLFYTPLTDPI